MKHGPALSEGWQARFLEHYRTVGGIWRSAELAGIHPETVRRYRHEDPVFDQAVRDAREAYADRLEEMMIASADRSDNPAGFIVRLKALRPSEYIEKHAIMSISLTGTLGEIDGAAVLRAIVGDPGAPTQQLLSTPPAQLPAATETSAEDAW
jgi:hypothetical protein